jgi:hypothetical protein
LALIAVVIACLVRKRRNSTPKPHQSEIRTDPAAVAAAADDANDSDDERGSYPSLSKTVSTTSIYTSAPPPVELRAMADYNLPPAPAQNYDYQTVEKKVEEPVTYESLPN